MRKLLAGVAALVVGGAGLVGCAYQNGDGGATVVPPPADVVARTGAWYYVPCVTVTGCEVDGVQYGFGALVPLSVDQVLVEMGG